MSDWYVDPTATGANNGTSKADAWINIQSAFDSVNTGGDRVFCRGIQTLTVSIDVDTNSGGSKAIIQFIGVNSSWVDDGTKFILDGDSTAVNCLLVNARSNLLFKNIKGINSTGSVFKSISTLIQVVRNNCEWSNGGLHGNEQGNFAYRTSITEERTNNNASQGHSNTPNEGQMSMCEAIGNGGTGFFSSTSTMLTNCLSHDNTGFGYQCQGGLPKYFGCTSDGNSEGWRLASNATSLHFCRITNNTIGVNAANSLTFLSYYNSFFGNGTRIATGVIIEIGTITLSSDGYTDRANDDFSLAVGGEGVGIEINIGGVGATTKANPTSGFSPAYPSADAPTFAGITRLEAVGKGHLKASWDAGSGTITGYNIYIRIGNSSVFSSTYKVFEVKAGATSAKISISPEDGNFLVNSKVYHVGIRACNDGSEDSNTEVLTASPQSDGLTTVISNEDIFRIVKNV